MPSASSTGSELTPDPCILESASFTVVSGETFASEPLVAEHGLELTPDSQPCRVEVAVPQPRLWWPWDNGRPDLYRLTVEVLDGDRVLDCCEELIGLRQVEDLLASAADYVDLVKLGWGTGYISSDLKDKIKRYRI